MRTIIYRMDKQQSAIVQYRDIQYPVINHNGKECPQKCYFSPYPKINSKWTKDLNSILKWPRDICIFPKKIYKQPTSILKMLNIFSHQGKENQNDDDTPFHIAPLKITDPSENKN